ncbi:phosphoglycerate dehydrogenase [Leuconostocaceae bacterium ESL0958]|nr:phosphoglycerate dehydrogenase [Leuconostocaceae bacterium ESL0958]
MQKILVFDGIDRQALAPLEAAGYTVESNPQASAKDFQKDDTVVGMIVLTYPIGPAEMDCYPNLKIIARHGVGYDSVDLQAATDRHIVVTNTPGANATAVAETAVTLMLMAGRLMNTRREGIFDPAAKAFMAKRPGMQVSQKTVGILGFGNIGRNIAELLTGFDVDVLAYARHDKEVPNGRMASLDEIYQEADFVVLALPGSASTEHLVDAAALKKMKKSAVLVNVGRGTVVDESALITALKENDIAAAGLDVVTQEPISPDNELLKLKNAYVLPHIGSDSAEAKERLAAMAGQEILKVLAGQPADSQVN